MKAGFCKAHMRSFCYNICNMNYKFAHMRFTESARNRQQSMESIYRFIAAICRANVQSLVKSL